MFPRRHFARETYPRRQVARDSPELSPGKMENVVVSEYTQCDKLIKCNIDWGSHEKQRNAKRDSYLKSLQFGGQNDNLQESHIVSARTRKRGSPYYLSQDEVNEGTSLKFRITLIEGKPLRVLVKSPEKVDVVPNMREVLSEKGVYRKANDDDSG
nr:hypothetical protein [Tanacetum cinerariifolium]